jgi:hypothetical protein
MEKPRYSRTKANLNLSFQTSSSTKNNKLKTLTLGGKLHPKESKKVFFFQQTQK